MWVIVDANDVMTFTTSGISLNNMLAGQNGTLLGHIGRDNEGLLNI